MVRSVTKPKKSFREFKTHLREHDRLRKNTSNCVSEGELVLVHDDHTKCGQWKMGESLIG